ncbi:MAG TPA: hypothetical protein GX707_15625 [Epulopiscium sp.]|nr:hypothetical protein [Candidatus Epulonipiscium sp.]
MNKRVIEYILITIGLIFCSEANVLHASGELTGLKAFIILSIALVTAGTACIMRVRRNPN